MAEVSVEREQRPQQPPPSIRILYVGVGMLVLFWLMAWNGWSLLSGFGFFIGTIICLSYVSLAFKHAVSEPERTDAEKLFDDHIGWLTERWTEIQRKWEAGEPPGVAAWFFDNVTGAQLAKLKTAGIALKDNRATKGQASDLIGLFEPTEIEHDDLLKFFKKPPAKLNQTTARYEVAKILADPQKVESWEERPATALQRECYRFLKIKPPRNLSRTAAIEFMRNHSNVDNELWREGEIYEYLYDEIDNEDFREDHEIKKVSLQVYRSAIEELQKAGKKLEDLEADIVIEKILEMKPDLRKAEAGS
jgi:hypothetical protein